MSLSDDILLLPRPHRVQPLGGEVRGLPRRVDRRVDPAAVPDTEGYRLTVTPDRVDILAHDAPGASYAEATLAQLRTHLAGHGPLPALQIDDRPDFRHRGVMLDISRDKVPTMATLFALVDRFAAWKLNELQLYMEHTFAYRGHDEVWRHASPLTPDEVRQLDAYCRARHIELVPNQNAFGHMERWLEHPRYAPLAEAPDGFTDPWGRFRPNPTTLCPTDPRSIALVEDLFDQLLPHFASRRFNVGCDETFDLDGRGRSRDAIEAKGAGRVYLDFLLRVLRAAQARGAAPQFWGDIIVKHPELIGELPAGVTALAWGYEADWPFDEQLAKFRAAGVPFYVCPGTSSWCSIAGRTDNALGNLRAAARAGRARGAVGFLNTDWGDHGHPQPLPVSFLGFAAGAALAWNADDDLPRDRVAALLDRFAFDDAAGVTGGVAYDLGNAYRHTGTNYGNGTQLFWLVRDRSRVHDADADKLAATGRFVRDTAARLDAAQIRRPDAALILDEFRHAARLLGHAARVGAALARGETPPPADPHLLDDHRRLWLARNREGGLADSTRKLREGLGL